MDYDDIREHLTAWNAEEIIQSMYDSSWNIEDDKIKEDIALTVDYYLPPNNADNPLYRTADLSAIVQAISNIHVILGGLETAHRDCVEATESALNFFLDDPVDFGYVNRISDDQLMLAHDPLKIYGTGRHWIYVYYNDVECHRAIKSLESISGAKTEYPCNVGKTNSPNSEKRVYDQTKNKQYIPTIPLFLRVDDEINLEKIIHYILKHRGKHIKNREDGEKEWFRTTPEEVYEIYRHIRDIW